MLCFSLHISAASPARRRSMSPRCASRCLPWHISFVNLFARPPDFPLCGLTRACYGWRGPDAAAVGSGFWPSSPEEVVLARGVCLRPAARLTPLSARRSLEVRCTRGSPCCLPLQLCRPSRCSFPLGRTCWRARELRRFFVQVPRWHAPVERAERWQCGHGGHVRCRAMQTQLRHLQLLRARQRITHRRMASARSP